MHPTSFMYPKGEEQADSEEGKGVKKTENYRLKLGKNENDGKL